MPTKRKQNKQKKPAKKTKTARRSVQTPSLTSTVPDIDNLKDFLKWIVLMGELEEERRVPERERIGHRWTIFPYQGVIYVGVATGLNGQEILDRYPEIYLLPISPPADEELPEDLKTLSFKPNLFYFGPFSQDDANLI